MKFVIIASAALFCAISSSCTPVTQSPITSGANQLVLSPGSVVEVHRTSIGMNSTAFYLPMEARSVVTLVVENKLGSRIYYLKGISKGRTVGGVVPRSALDESGFNAKNDPKLAVIQSSLNRSPVYIEVK